MLNRARRRSTSLVAPVVVALVVALLGLTPPAAGAAKPAPPTGLATSDSGPTPTFTWDRVAKATGYRIEADNNADFSSPLFSMGTPNDAYVHTRRLPRGDVHWRVRTLGEGGESSWATEVVTVGSATEIPTPVSPVNGAEVMPPVDPPALQWEAVAGAVSYRVEVSGNDTFTSATSWSTKSTSFVVPTPQGVGTYYWRVRTEFDGGMVSDWSPAANYAVAELPLIEPGDALSPEPSASVQDVVLQWAPVAGAHYYHLQVATDRAFNEIVDNQQRVYSTRYSPAVTYPNNDYFWRVRAVNSAGEPTGWATAPMEFQRRWSDRPMPVHPADGVLPPVGDPLYFEWTPVHHAMRYRLEVGTDPNFTPNTFKVCYSAQTTYTIGHLQPGDSCGMPSQGGVYYWRVLAVEPGLGAEVPSIYSPIRRFIYDSGAVELVAPADGATVDVPTLEWAAQRDAERYHLTVKNNAGQTVVDITTHALSWTPTATLDPAKGPYTWTVQARDANQGESPRYPGRSFELSGTLPDDPTAAPLEPLETDRSSGRFPSLEWEPHPDATYYRIDIGVAGSGFLLDPSTAPILNRTLAYPASTDESSYFLNPATYQWRVRAFDASNSLLGTGPFATFTIEELAPVTGRAIGLTGGSTQTAGTRCGKQLGATIEEEQICTGVPSTPVLSWDPVPGAAAYMVYLAEDRDLTQLVYGNSSTNQGIPVTQNTMWTPPGNLGPISLPDNQSGQAYFWYVRPCKGLNKGCAVDPLNTDDAATNAFRKISPSIELHTPEDDASVANQVIFSWEDYLTTNETVSFPEADPTSPTSAQTAHRYRIQVFTSPSAGSPVDDQIVDQTTYVAWRDTYPEGDLWWRVQAIDAANNGLAWSEMRHLKHETPYPNLNSTESLPTGIEGPPDGNVHPALDATVRGDVALRWTARNYDTSWNLEVYRDDDTTGSPGNLVFKTKTSQAAYSWTQLLPTSPSAYRWRIQRMDARGRVGPWSDWGRFFVKGYPVTLLQPGEGLRPADDLLFSWTTVPDAVNYRLELTGSDGGQSRTVTTAATAWAPDFRLSTGSYSWKVRAFDASNGQLGVSPTWSFTVDETGPTVVRYKPGSSARRKANFVAIFSEPVAGVSKRTMKLYQQGRKRALRAKVTLNSAGTTAKLNPASKLRRGRVYTVVLKPRIRDEAGNRLAKFTWSVTAR